MSMSDIINFQPSAPVNKPIRVEEKAKDSIDSKVEECARKSFVALERK